MGRLVDIDSLKGCAIIRPTNHESIEHIKQCGNDVLNHNDIPTAYDDTTEIIYNAGYEKGYRDGKKEGAANDGTTGATSSQI